MQPVIACILVATAAAQPVDRVEVIPISTASPGAKQFLTGEGNAKPAIIAGELRLPRPGPEKLPAVVLLHGSSGINSRQDRWVQELNSVGLATFLVDSFAGREIVNTVNDQSQLSSFAMMIDAYRSLAILRQHPRIDPNRISVIGFSKGAIASVYSALDRFRKMYAPGEATFAAHIGLYTPCQTTYREDDKVSSRPIRLFHGTADDWTSIAPCRAYVARLKKAGADATLTEYEGAHHAYDAYTLEKPFVYAQGLTWRNCVLHENEAGDVINTKTGKLSDFSDPCIEKGPQVAYDRAAHEATLRAVKALLATAVATR